MFSKDLKRGLLRYLKNQSALAKISGVSQPTLSRFSKGKFGSDALLRIMDSIGAEVTFPDDPRTEVVLTSNLSDSEKLSCITIPKINERSLAKSPNALSKTDNLIAISTNVLPKGFSTNLIAIQLGKKNDRFHPLFYPEDIVIFDKNSNTKEQDQALSIVRIDGLLKLALTRPWVIDGHQRILICENLKNINFRIIDLKSAEDWNTYVLGRAAYSLRVLA